MIRAVDPLTARQRAVYDFVRKAIEETGVAPSVREIGDAFGITSPNGVICHLRVLERRGYLTRRSGGQARNLQLANEELLSLHVTHDLAARLRARAEEAGVPIGDFVRRALEEAYGRKSLAMLGRIS